MSKQKRKSPSLTTQPIDQVPAVAELWEVLVQDPTIENMRDHVRELLIECLNATPSDDSTIEDVAQMVRERIDYLEGIVEALESDLEDAQERRNDPLCGVDVEVVASEAWHAYGTALGWRNGLRSWFQLDADQQNAMVQSATAACREAHEHREAR